MPSDNGVVNQPLVRQPWDGLAAMPETDWGWIITSDVWAMGMQPWFAFNEVVDLIRASEETDPERVKMLLARARWWRDIRTTPERAIDEEWMYIQNALGAGKLNREALDDGKISRIFAGLWKRRER